MESSEERTPAVVVTEETQKDDKPKPCCVCKEDKAERDKCMLYSGADDPAQECQSVIDRYRQCMEGFGFKV